MISMIKVRISCDPPPPAPHPPPAGTGFIAYGLILISWIRTCLRVVCGLELRAYLCVFLAATTVVVIVFGQARVVAGL
jgi:hypothetical protein